MLGGANTRPGERRREAEELQVDGQEEEVRAERRVHDERDEVRAREPGHAQERRRHHRVARLQRPDDEAGERDDSDDEERQHLVEPLLAHLDERVGDPDEADGDEARADEVEGRAAVRLAVVAAPGQREHDGEGRERHVDQEDPAPRDRLHDDAAERRPAHGREAREGGPEADRPARLARPGHPEQREARRRQHGAADSLQRPAADQHPLARRERGEQRCQGEEDDADDERAPEADPVADRAADEVEGRERERVRQVDPLLTAEAEPEVLLHPRQRHDHDGRVEERERRAERRREQRQQLHAARRLHPRTLSVGCNGAARRTGGTRRAGSGRAALPRRHGRAQGLISGASHSSSR